LIRIENNTKEIKFYVEGNRLRLPSVLFPFFIVNCTKH